MVRKVNPRWRYFAARRPARRRSPVSPRGIGFFVHFPFSTALTVFPALAFTPSADFIIDIAPYPSDTNRLTDALLKTLYTHLNPSLAILSGVDDLSFNVSLGDAALMTEGGTIIVRDGNYGFQSPEVIVESIVGTLITVSKTLGFTPSSSDFLECGFLDGLGFYRYS